MRIVVVKFFLVICWVIVAGCATQPAPENAVPVQMSPLKAEHPIVTISAADRQILIDGMWKDQTPFKESIYSEDVLQNSMFQIVMAGLLVHCDSREYKLLRIDKDNDVKGETWTVDVCGEKKVLLDSEGTLQRIGDVIFQPARDENGRTITHVLRESPQ